MLLRPSVEKVNCEAVRKEAKEERLMASGQKKQAAMPLKYLTYITVLSRLRTNVDIIQF